MSKPRLGQHFLTDTTFLQPIMDAAEVSAEDAVVEVGPGKGILTKALCTQAGRVLALELDERLANHLHERLGAKINLEVRLQDARRVDWAQTAAELRARI